MRLAAPEPRVDALSSRSNLATPRDPPRRETVWIMPDSP